MNKDMNVVDVQYYRSKDNQSGANNMARVTIELPISTWRAMKSKQFGDEIISHQRRMSDLKKEIGVKCPQCSKDEILLRECTGVFKEESISVKYKKLFYKCKRCNEEFSTELIEKENKKRIEMNKDK